VLKRDTLDAVVSDLVRERDDWTCQHSGRQFPDRKGRDIHASHFISRIYSSVRWFPDNIVTLSAAAHDHMGKNPDEHDALIRRVLGDERYERLLCRKRQIYRYRAADKKAMVKHYRSELERIRELRRNGAVGPLHVVPFD
jgi:hypothetical protein